MKRWTMFSICILALILCASGCASAKAKGNVGQAAVMANQAAGEASTATTAAFNPHDMGTVKSGGDASAIKTAGDLIMRVEGGRIGLTIVAITLAIGMVVVACKSVNVALEAVKRLHA